MTAKLTLREQLVGDGCHANDDGDCAWQNCPQLRDNEPKKTGRHCPRDYRVTDPDSEGRADNG